MMTAIFICQTNIRKISAQLLEVRPEIDKAFLRSLLLDEEGKLLALQTEKSLLGPDP